MNYKLHIGMRKIKSILAVFLSFLGWQALRIFMPALETHPIFAYVYSIIEMRESAQKTKDFGKLRIIATVIGLIVGLAFVFCTVYATSYITSDMLKAFVELLLILLASLCSLVLAEISGCKDFCGAAAIITVVCMVSRTQDDIYLYAIMRVVQTMIGVLSAVMINLVIPTKTKSVTEKEKIDEKDLRK